MTDYLSAIWRCRYFWMSLVRMDLRTRYRRSFLGLGWSLLHPIAMTTILCLVFHAVFNQPIREFGPYLLAGLATWNYFLTTALQGCQCFFQGESYIRQYPAPLAIYPLRTALAGTIHFLLALLVTLGLSWYCKGFTGESWLIDSVKAGLIERGVPGDTTAALMATHSIEQIRDKIHEFDLLRATNPTQLSGDFGGWLVTTISTECGPRRTLETTLIGLLSLVPTIVLLFIFAWSVAVLTGFANVHFQDTQHLSEVGFQILFYATPIMYRAELLGGSIMGQLLKYNPLLYIIEVIRVPIVDGHIAEFRIYVLACTTVLATVLAAACTLTRLQRRLIFHL